MPIFPRKASNPLEDRKPKARFSEDAPTTIPAKTVQFQRHEAYEEEEEEEEEDNNNNNNNNNLLSVNVRHIDSDEESLYNPRITRVVSGSIYSGYTARTAVSGTSTYHSGSGRSANFMDGIYTQDGQIAPDSDLLVTHSTLVSADPDDASDSRAYEAELSSMIRKRENARPLAQQRINDDKLKNLQGIANTQKLSKEISDLRSTWRREALGDDGRDYVQVKPVRKESGSRTVSGPAYSTPGNPGAGINGNSQYYSFYDDYISKENQRREAEQAEKRQTTRWIIQQDPSTGHVILGGEGLVDQPPVALPMSEPISYNAVLPGNNLKTTLPAPSSSSSSSSNNNNNNNNTTTTTNNNNNSRTSVLEMPAAPAIPAYTQHSNGSRTSSRSNLSALPESVKHPPEPATNTAKSSPAASHTGVHQEYVPPAPEWFYPQRMYGDDDSDGDDDRMNPATSDATVAASQPNIVAPVPTHAANPVEALQHDTTPVHDLIPPPSLKFDNNHSNNSSSTVNSSFSHNSSSTSLTSAESSSSLQPPKMIRTGDEISPFSMKALYGRYKGFRSQSANGKRPANNAPQTQPRMEMPSPEGTPYSKPRTMPGTYGNPSPKPPPPLPQPKPSNVPRSKMITPPTVPMDFSNEDEYFANLYNKVSESHDRQNASASAAVIPNNTRQQALGTPLITQAKVEMPEPHPNHPTSSNKSLSGMTILTEPRVRQGKRYSTSAARNPAPTETKRVEVVGTSKASPPKNPQPEVANVHRNGTAKSVYSLRPGEVMVGVPVHNRQPTYPNSIKPSFAYAPAPAAGSGDQKVNKSQKSQKSQKPRNVPLIPEGQQNPNQDRLSRSLYLQQSQQQALGGPPTPRPAQQQLYNNNYANAASAGFGAAAGIATAAELASHSGPAAAAATPSQLEEPNTGQQLYSQWLGAKQRVNNWVSSSTPLGGVLNSGEVITAKEAAAMSQGQYTKYHGREVPAGVQDAANHGVIVGDSELGADNEELLMDEGHGIPMPVMIPGTPRTPRNGSALANKYPSVNSPGMMPIPEVPTPHPPTPAALPIHNVRSSLSSTSSQGSGNSIRIPIMDVQLKEIEPSLYTINGAVDEEMVSRSAPGTPMVMGKATFPGAAIAENGKKSPSKWKSLFKNKNNSGSKLSKMDVMGPPSLSKMEYPDVDAAAMAGLGVYNSGASQRSKTRSMLDTPSGQYASSTMSRRNFKPDAANGWDSNMARIQDFATKSSPYLLPVIQLIRTAARNSLVLAPVDRIADNIPVLLPTVVILESFLLLWLLHQVAVMLEMVTGAVRYVSSPAAAVGRTFGVGSTGAVAGADAASAAAGYPPNMYQGASGQFVNGVGQIGQGVANMAGGVVRNVVQGAAHGVGDGFGAVDGLGHMISGGAQQYQQYQQVPPPQQAARWFWY